MNTHDALFSKGPIVADALDSDGKLWRRVEYAPWYTAMIFIYVDMGPMVEMDDAAFEEEVRKQVEAAVDRIVKERTKANMGRPG